MVIYKNRWAVREFKEADFEQVKNVWTQTGLARPERADSLQTILKTISHGGTLLVLEDLKENIIVGTSWITNDGRRLHLQYFGILPGYQGQKLSHFLMAESLKFAQKQGLQIKLEVHNTNFKAINLYKKWGFKCLDGYQIYILRDIKNIDFGLVD